MLSPRILHFSKFQVFWDCSEVAGCKGLPQGIPRIASGSARLDQRWRRQLQSGKSLKARSRVGVEDESIEPQYRFRGRDEMEGVYRVRNHEGCDIQFETEGQKTKNKDGVEAYADTPPKLAGGEIGVIAIKGYLKKGLLLRDQQTYRWKLSPVRDYIAKCTVRSSGEGDGTVSDDMVLPEAFPD